MFWLRTPLKLKIKPACGVRGRREEEANHTRCCPRARPVCTMGCSGLGREDPVTANPAFTRSQPHTPSQPPETLPHLRRKCMRPGGGSAPGGLQTALSPAPTGSSLGKEGALPRKKKKKTDSFGVQPHAPHTQDFVAKVRESGHLEVHQGHPIKTSQNSGSRDSCFLSILLPLRALDNGLALP